MINILMTGATGYLGSHLAERLLSQPDRYTLTVLKRSFSNDVRIRPLLPRLRVFNIDRTDLADIVRDGGYNVILHAATHYGRRTAPLTDILDANLMLPLRLLEAGITHGVRTFINTDTMLDKRVSEYSLSKRHFNEWLNSQSRRIAAINVSLEHFYGPGDDDSKFVSRILRSLLRQVDEIALTDGTQRRDFVYVDDVVDAFMHIIEANSDVAPGYHDYEVGSGCSIPVRQFVETAHALCDHPRTRLLFGAIPHRPNEAMDVRVNIDRLRALGWAPRWSLEAGLAHTIQSEWSHV
jgi:CDP-paratose synthetase